MSVQNAADNGTPIPALTAVRVQMVTRTGQPNGQARLGIVLADAEVEPGFTRVKLDGAERPTVVDTARVTVLTPAEQEILSRPCMPGCQDSALHPVAAFSEDIACTTPELIVALNTMLRPDADHVPQIGVYGNREFGGEPTVVLHLATGPTDGSAQLAAYEARQLGAHLIRVADQIEGRA